jgi:hypothetical protein
MDLGKPTIVESLSDLCLNISRLAREEDVPQVQWRSSSSRPEVKIDSGGLKRVLKIEPTLHPSRRLLETGEADGDRLILAPSLGEPLARDLRTVGINHADLNGRLYLRLGSPPLLIDRRPSAKQFTNSQSEPDVFAAKSTRLLRTVLSARDALWTQAALAERSGLSRGLISRLVRTLVANGYVKSVTPSTRQKAGTWRVVEFDRLLDTWRERDKWPSRGRLLQYSVLGDNPQQTARKLQRWLGASQPVFTQWFAANLRQAYTDTPVVSAYVADVAELSRIPARAVPTGGNLWIIVPRDDGPMREAHEADGFRLACDVQIYLDLLGAGGRGSDHAQVLRHWSGFAR